MEQSRSSSTLGVIVGDRHPCPLSYIKRERETETERGRERERGKEGEREREGGRD